MPAGALIQRLFSRLGLGDEAARIGRNSGWLLAERGFRLLVSLFVNAWLVRYLGADRLGLLSFGQSIVVTTAVLSQIGLEGILVRDLVREPDTEPTLLGTALWLRVTGWIGTAALAAGIAVLLRPGDRQAWVLVVVLSTIALSQCLDVIEYWFQSRTSMAPVVRARTVAFVIAAVAKVTAIRLGLPLTAIALIMAGEQALMALGLAVAYSLEGGSLARWRASGARARRLLADSWPLMLNSVAIVISVRVDQMILTSLRGTTENGFYAAAQRLTEIVYYFPVAVMATANPVLLQSHARSADEYARRLQRLLSTLAWIGTLGAVVVSIASPLIIRVLFGAEFAPSAPALSILVWAAPVLFMGVAQTNWFIAEGRQRGLMLRSAVAAAASVALNFLLVPSLGARGSAIALVVSQTFSCWLLNGLLPSSRPLFRMQCQALLSLLPRRATGRVPQEAP